MAQKREKTGFLMRLACNADIGVVLLRYFSYAEGVYSRVAVLPRRAGILGLSSVSWKIQQSNEKREVEECYHLSMILKTKCTCLCCHVEIIC